MTILEIANNAKTIAKTAKEKLRTGQINTSLGDNIVVEDNIFKYKQHKICVCYLAYKDEADVLMVQLVHKTKGYYRSKYCVSCKIESGKASDIEFDKYARCYYERYKGMLSEIMDKCLDKILEAKEG